MTRDMLRRAAPALVLCLALTGRGAGAQTLVVNGTVSAAGSPVRSASVTFQDASAPQKFWTTVTDSSGAYRLSIVVTSARPSPALPSRFALGQNYPNPFAAKTIVPFTLERQSAIELTVYDVLGRVVRRIAAGAQPAGSHAAIWDGTNDRGQRVAGGVYFCTLTSGGVVQARKMIMSGGAPLEIRLAPGAGPGPAGAPAAIALQGGTFSVRIDDTTGTSPWIATMIVGNVALQRDTTLNFAVSALPVAAVVVDSLQQVIRGFGAANILPWRPDMTVAEVLTAFGTGSGQLGFTILRLRIPYTDSPDDFSAQV
ncbi:MAG TPA: FlgD immunoglobulin-like domain containing protein, partial [Bacteroidota bacterium]|nr:FlgD immunoglobulin-like domain containing protein [Bacteroidota bacterium]